MKATFVDNIGENIKRARKERGLTQRELGEKIGKKYSTVQKYENGIIEPPISVIRDIAAALGVDPYSIASFDAATKMLEESINAREAAQKRLAAACKKLTSEGLEKAADIVEIIAGNPKYQWLDYPEDN